MRNSHFHPNRSMTKDDVLRAIRDSYRFSEQLDPEAEQGYDLTFETTVDEWRAACDLLAAGKLGQALNAWFNVSFSNTDWMATLEPAKKATLEGVCELIASKAQMADIKPFAICGTQCLSGKEGIPVEGIRPSTPLAPTAYKHLSSFIAAMGRLAPDVLPVPEVKHGIAHRIGRWCGACGFMLLLVSAVTSSTKLALLGLLLLIIGVSLCLYSGAEAFKNASFGEIKTFRDLTKAVMRRT